MNLTAANPAMLDETTSPDTNTESPDILFSNTNFAEKLSDDDLTAIGEYCRNGFENDLRTREDWESDLDEWIKLAKQVREQKSYPWPRASNVKYPLLSTAAMQFSARSYPSLVPSNGKLVNARVVGKDLTGEKLEKATRVSTFMSYQLLQEMRGWEEGMDKLLMMLPIVGTMFKKTWYDKGEDRIRSEVILPKNLVVNYWTKSLDESERISEIIEMSPRKLREKQRAKVYLDVDLGSPTIPTNEQTDHAADDDTTPYELIEQHTWYDIKKNGVDVPLIVTFERYSGQVLRIAPRYNINDVVLMDDEKTIKYFQPIQMYTKFGFIPNPDGGFYDIGFGILLGPLNESVNTLINQLIDSGSLSTLQSGFIGKGMRLKMGDQRFQPGEWKPVNATGDDLRKQIVPLPTKEPSNVLFQLMGTLITSGKELASVAEIFVGKMPGQNTPATTTMASIEQGMKVFTAVYKRIYRSLGDEFLKIFALNKMYLDPNHYVEVIDTQIGPDDFDSSACDISPGADPTAVSQTEKLLKAQGLLELLPMAPGMLDPIKVFQRVLEAQEQPNWQDLFSAAVQQSGQLPPPPPDPKLMAIQAKVEADQRKAAVDIQSKQMDMELKGREAALQMQMEKQKHAQQMQMDQEKTMSKAASELAMANIFASTERAKGQQQLVQKDQAHQQKMQQTKESQKLSQTSNSKTGKPTQSQKPSNKK